jgi:hypothetical protein
MPGTDRPGISGAGPTPTAEPTRASNAQLGGVRRHHQQLAVQLHLLLFGALLVAAVLGNLPLAVVVLGLAVAHDYTLSKAQPASEEILERNGAGPWTRAILRSLLVAVAFGVASEGSDVEIASYGVLAVLVHGCGLVTRTIVAMLLWRSPVLGVRNIGEGLPYRRAIELARRVRDVGGFGFLALEWVGALVLAVASSGSASGGVLVLIVALVALPAVVATAVIVLRGRRAMTRGAKAYASALFEQLRAYEPACIVYMSSGPGQSGYILNQWLPALDAMSMRAIVVVREESNVGPIGRTRLPVLFAPQTRDVEQLVLPSVRMAFYLANAGRNVHLQREPAVKHLFLNHGDSDKSTSANPVSRVYDEVWVAGQAAIDRYHAAGVDIPTDHFAIVGRPQVDPLVVGPLPGPTRTLLYAPTFEGYYQEANYSSLEVMGVALIRRVQELRPDLRIVFKPHPSTGVQRLGMRAARAQINALLRQSDRHLVADDHPGMTLNDCFDQADLLVSDISSVVTDFLHTERPILISNPTTMPHEQFRMTFPTQAASYVVDHDLGDLGALLDDALDADSLAEQRREMKRYVLGDLPEGPLRAFDDNVTRVYEEAAAHAARVHNSFTVVHADPHLRS